MSKTKTINVIPLGNYSVSLDGCNYVLEAGAEVKFPEKVAKHLIKLEVVKKKNG